MSTKHLKIASLAMLFFLCAAASGSLSVGEQVQADEALQLLKDGNARFVAMKLEHPHETIRQREQTGTYGQSPFAAVLSCSDSRVPVEIIFDRGIGDIFVVRVAGNTAADNSIIGSLEYAAEHLKTPLLVVMGHTDCGAVKSVISGGILEGKISDIQKEIAPVAIMTKQEHPDLIGPDLINAVAKNNALQAKADIISRSDIIRGLIESGKLKIVTAVYNVKTGAVEWAEQRKDHTGKEYTGTRYGESHGS